VKVALVVPPETETVDGAIAEAWLLERPMAKPAAGAGLLRVTVPVELVPPTTLAGLKTRLKIVGGKMVKDALMDEAPKVAVLLATVLVATAEVEIVNVVDVAP